MPTLDECYCCLSGRHNARRGTADQLVERSEVNSSVLVHWWRRAVSSQTGARKTVWNLLYPPLPKLWSLGAQPCQPGGRIKVTHQPQPREEGCEGWWNSYIRAATGGRREGKTLSGQQEASQLFSFFSCWSVKTPAKDKLTSSGTSIWFHFLHQFFLVWPARCPRPEARGAFGGNVETPSSPLCLIPHRFSLLLLSFLPPLWLLYLPSPLTGGFSFSFLFFFPVFLFFFFSPLGGTCSSCRATEWKRDREWRLKR